MSIESMMPSSHLVLCNPFLLMASIFPSIRVFSNDIPWWLQSWHLMPLKGLSLRSPTPIVKYLTSVAFDHLNCVTLFLKLFLFFSMKSCSLGFQPPYLTNSQSSSLFTFSSDHPWMQLNLRFCLGSLLFSAGDLHHFCAFNYHPYWVNSGFPKSIHQDVIKHSSDLLG